MLLSRGALTEDTVRGCFIGAVVKEDDHAIGVHGLAGVEVVLELLEGVGRYVVLDTSLELLDLLLRGVSGLHVLLDLLDVLLEVAHVRLLVERGFLEAERVDDVEGGGGGVISTFVTTILSRGVGTDVCKRSC